MYVYVYIYIYVCICIWYMYVYIVCVYIYTHIYIYMYKSIDGIRLQNMCIYIYVYTMIIVTIIHFLARFLVISNRNSNLSRNSIGRNNNDNNDLYRRTAYVNIYIDTMCSICFVQSIVCCWEHWGYCVLCICDMYTLCMCLETKWSWSWWSHHSK